MTQSVTTERPRRSASESLVVEKIDEGYRVYSPANRNRLYLVTGTDDDPACTCADFRAHLEESGYRCQHIDAVAQMAKAEPAPETTAQGSDPDPPPASANGNGHGSESGASLMMLKRSISPDRRIDSFSIEFSSPVPPGTSPEAVSRRAQNILAVQSGIVSYFLSANSAGRSDKPATKAASADNGDAIPGTMLEIGSGKDGRSLFITFDVDGETMRFFGKKEELADAIRNAGYADRSQGIRRGKKLDLPCLVITEESKDGRYTNVVEVLPPADGGNGNGKRGH